MTTSLLYNAQLEEKIIEWLQQRIPSKLVAHVQRVAATAEELTCLYVPDSIGVARIAGLIHDAAKPMDDADLLRIALEKNYPVTPIERQVPMLLHGAVGYLIANEVFGFNDPILMSACALHTTGAPDMSTLDKIIFLADLIEPARDFPKVNKLRRDAKQDLDVALLRAADHTLKYLLKQQRLVDGRLLELHNQLIQHGVRYGNRAAKKIEASQ